MANLTPWALADLLGEAAPPRLRQKVKQRASTWGAFTVYLGLDAASLSPGAADHHQVIVDPMRPPGEGNTVFISLSDPVDPERAPAGMRAATGIPNLWLVGDSIFPGQSTAGVTLGGMRVAAAVLQTSVFK